MARPKSHGSPKDSPAHLGFEAKLWLSADTALRESAFLPTGGKPQVMTERQDNLRNNLDAAEPSGARQPERSGDSPAYFISKGPGQTAASSPEGERGGANQSKHVVLGLIFLKYISDTFDEHHAKLVASANPGESTAGAWPAGRRSRVSRRLSGRFAARAA